MIITIYWLAFNLLNREQGTDLRHAREAACGRRRVRRNKAVYNNMSNVSFEERGLRFVPSLSWQIEAF